MPKLVLLWTLSLFLFPVLVIQGIWTRQRGLKLPEASGPNLGEIDGQAPAISILGIGDSVVAGVGVDNLGESLTAQIANSIATKTERKVRWLASGSNGDRVSDLLSKYQKIGHGGHAVLQFSDDGELIDAKGPSATESSSRETKPDYVVVSIGVNDVSHLTSLTRWNFEITQVIAELRECYGVPIMFLGIPPMDSFPGLPQPLRFALGVRAKMLDKTIQRASELLSDVHWVDTNRVFKASKDETHQQDYIGEDGYHPSTLGCNIMGEKIAETVVQLELAASVVRQTKGDRDQ